MNRRRFLRRVGVGGSSALAGCVFGGGGSEEVVSFTLPDPGLKRFDMDLEKGQKVAIENRTDALGYDGEVFRLVEGESGTDVLGVRVRDRQTSNIEYQTKEGVVPKTGTYHLIAGRAQDTASSDSEYAVTTTGGEGSFDARSPGGLGDEPAANLERNLTELRRDLDSYVSIEDQRTSTGYIPCRGATLLEKIDVLDLPSGQRTDLESRVDAILADNSKAIAYLKADQYLGAKREAVHEGLAREIAATTGLGGTEQDLLKQSLDRRDPFEFVLDGFGDSSKTEVLARYRLEGEHEFDLGLDSLAVTVDVPIDVTVHLDWVVAAIEYRSADHAVRWADAGLHVG